MPIDDDLTEYGLPRGLSVHDLQLWTFLDEGKAYIRNMKYLQTMPLSSLLKTPTGHNALRYAVYRARCALHDNAPPVGIRKNDERILSYFFLRMLISYSSNPPMFADKIATHLAHIAYVDYLRVSLIRCSRKTFVSHSGFLTKTTRSRLSSMPHLL